MIDRYTLAFPATTEHGYNSGVTGITLRDYFAAAAMKGLSANISTNGWGSKEIARVSYLHADHMMEAKKA